MQFLQRKVYLKLKEHLAMPEISLILGPRQAGKTTLMMKLREEVNNAGRPTAYFNLDVIEDRQYFISQHTLLERIEKTVRGGKAVIFIDEVQRLDNAGLFLKGLYDLGSGHKFIVSGSGSLELKESIIEPMTGRKKVFFCLSLSFSEFIAHKLNTALEEESTLLESNQFELQRLRQEYFTYGGYPRVVLATTYGEKVEILSEIYHSYLEKDIQLLLEVKKEASFSALVKVLASQVGNLINRTELASTLGVNVKTVEKYLYLLEKTYVIALVKPFFNNVRKELSKLPKVYFLDLGFLSLAKQQFPSNRPITGDTFENACFLRILELDLSTAPRFWRSSSGAEVDFVVPSPQTGEPVPIEVKRSLPRSQTVGKSLVSFIGSYKPRKTFFYTLDQVATFTRFGAEVEYLPYHQLLKLNSGI